MNPDKTAPMGAVCSGSTLFASILNSSVMLGNYLQQTTSVDDIYRCMFFLALQRLMHQCVHMGADAQAGLRHCCSQTPKDRFSCVEALMD